VPTGRLFTVDAPERARVEWGRWFPVPRGATCPDVHCCTPLTRMPSAVQPALFYHGGYGAAVQSIYEVCLSCGWTRTVETNAVNPRTLSGG